VRFGKPELDLAGIRGFKEKVVGRLVGGVGQLAKRRKVNVVQGTGKFVDPHALEVEAADGSRRRITFEQAIVAAGSRVIELPNIPYDDPRVMDSTGALELQDVPKRLLVIGGGIIGLEMATVYAALGSRVTVVELTDSLLPGVDADLVKPLRKRLDSHLDSIHLETKVAAVAASAQGLEAKLEGKDGARAESFDRVLVAVGRRPNGDRIDAAKAGLQVDGKGFLPVDDQMRTNVPHVFAIGDVARPPLLAHKAMHEGKVAAEVAAGSKAGWLGRVVPSVAYTDPEVAWVGLTETEAKAKGIAYGKGSFPWAANGRSLSLGRDEGLTKLLFDPQTERLLGGALVGVNAGELIAEIGHAIEMGSTAADLALTVHAHPTLPETIAGAAEVFEGTATDVYAPKRAAREKAQG
jgi:dihydrolipoamide dehydrogenase